MWFLVLFGQPAGMGSDGFRPQASDQHNVPQLRVPASTPFSVLNNIMEALVKAGSSNCMKWEWNRFTSIKVSVADITVCRRAVRRQNDTRHDTFINKINRGQQQAIKVCKHNSQRFFFSTTKPKTSSEWGHHQSNPCWITERHLCEQTTKHWTSTCQTLSHKATN